MNKPDSLRAHLLATVPELKHNPDLLQIFIDKGAVRCTAAATLSWEYAYELQLILLDYAGHPDAVMLPLLGWISVNQPELLSNLTTAGEGIAFEADIIDRSKVDLAVTLPLTERVVVATDDTGATTITHPGEPQWAPDAPGEPGHWYVPQ